MDRNHFFKHVPLFEAFRNLSLKERRSTIFMYFLLAGVSCFIVSKLFFSSVQKISLEQFHLRSSSFSTWAMRQLVPSMYNFSNELWFLQSSSNVLHHEWFNHYPTRFVTFNLYRNIFYSSGKGQSTKLIRLESRYRGLRVQTVYEFQMTPEGLLMKPQEEKTPP